MISQECYELGSKSSVIREIFSFGLKRKAEVGEDKVYDFSLGNPSIPAPPSVKRAILELLEEPAESLHAYSPAPGDPKVRAIVADSLNRRFGETFTAENIFMTCGAAASLSICLKALVNPGDEVVTFAPFFTEYRCWVEAMGASLEVVPPSVPDFQVDTDAFERIISAKTKAVIVNTPNNPSGVVYSEETIKKLAAILVRKSEEYGSPIYLITDEPYREIVYDGIQVPYLTKYYDNTVIGYSYSKSLSLPGERIGYVLIPDESDGADEFIDAATIANRVSGCVNAPSLIQLAIGRCADITCDISYYETNGRLLYDGLTALGFSCVKPQGAFYLWVKAPGGDDKAFSQAAKKYGILMVPGTSFAGPGYVRISYCVAKETIERALPAFKKLASEVL